MANVLNADKQAMVVGTLAEGSSPKYSCPPRGREEVISSLQLIRSLGVHGRWTPVVTLGEGPWKLEGVIPSDQPIQLANLDTA